MSEPLRRSDPLAQRREAAHGGPGWGVRADSLASEMGTVWGDYGVTCEYGRLRSVLLKRPGSEMRSVSDPSAALWSEIPDADRAQEQHDHLAALYADHGVQVSYIEDSPIDKPNIYFCRDLFAMTPQGAIISRPASTARAGEERWAALALARLGVPILLTVFGHATFEGADLVFATPELAFIGEGIRTNREGARLVRRLCYQLGIPNVEVVQLNYGCGHLDGVLSIIDRDLAMLYPTQVSYRVWEVLTYHGFRIIDLPDASEAQYGMAINLVPLAPRVVLMPSGNPRTRRVLEAHDVMCLEVDVSELMKGGGAVHCMTGVLKRDPVN